VELAAQPQLADLLVGAGDAVRDGLPSRLRHTMRSGCQSRQCVSSQRAALMCDRQR
jgi:hypothetical protein